MIYGMIDLKYIFKRYFNIYYGGAGRSHLYLEPVGPKKVKCFR